MRCLTFVTAMLLAACISGRAVWGAEIGQAPPITAELFNPYPERAMESRNLAPTPKDFSGSGHIRIEGDIEPGDIDKLKPLLNSVDRFNDVVVSLNSTGGNLSAALELADLIHDSRVATYVGAGDVCLSACAWIFLAGQNEWIRNVLFVPARFLHWKGQVGLHAPFNQEVPEGPVDALTAEYVAELYYSIAREAIRDINERMEPWSISPRLVVELLGKGPTEFYDIDRFWKLTQNQIGLVVDKVNYPSEIGLIQAVAGCDFVMSVNLGPTYDYGWGFVWFDGPERFLEGGYLKNARSGDVARITTPSGTPGLMYFSPDAVVLGRGPFKCTVKKNERGRWEVSTEGPFPPTPDRLGDDPRIDNEPYELNSYTMLGPALPWTVIGQPDLYIEGEDKDEDRLNDDLATTIPAEYRDIVGPGFNCGGALDPAAKVICRFPTLARMDGVMGALYRDRVKVDAVQRAKQQAWVQLRDDACQVRRIDLSDDASVMMNGYCLLFLTVARINELNGK